MHSASSSSKREALSERHFIQLSNLIESNVGIRMPAAKRTMVDGRLRKRAKALGLASVADYGVHIFDEGGFESELPHLIDCMTTNKTDFFREPSHFEALRDEILPSILGPASQSQEIKIWSAAASSGAEAFTIAMVLDDELRGRPKTTFSILGTDVCHDILAQARRAIYPADMTSPIPPQMRQRYLMEARDKKRAEVRIVPELRKAVRFAHLNLMDDTYRFDRDMDVIFCRNVLIYFSRPVQDEVVARLVSHLKPGGYLILGHSESMAGSSNQGVNQVLPTVYRRSAKREEQRQWPIKARA